MSQGKQVLLTSQTLRCYVYIGSGRTIFFLGAYKGNMGSNPERLCLENDKKCLRTVYLLCPPCENHSHVPVLDEVVEGLGLSGFTHG